VTDRAALTGILFVLKTGLPWEDLPCEMNCGCGMTYWRRLRDWQADGTWDEIHKVLLDRLRGAEKINWARALIDSSFVRAADGGEETGPSPVDRAISLRPYRGEISFNTTSREKKKGDLSLRGRDAHDRVPVFVRPEPQRRRGQEEHRSPDRRDRRPAARGRQALAVRLRLLTRVDHPAVHFLPFVPDQNCFEHDEETRGYAIGRLVHRIEAGDVPASELMAGGLLAKTEWGEKLKSLGISMHNGVLAAASEAKARIAGLREDFVVVEGKGAAG
jgi:transposase